MSPAPRHPLYSSGTSSSVTFSSSSTAGLARAGDTSWVTLGSGVSSGCPCGQVGVWGALTRAADRNCAQQGQGEQQVGLHGTGALGTPLAPLGDPRALSSSAMQGTPPWALCHPQHHPVLPMSPQKPPPYPHCPSAIPSATLCPVPSATPASSQDPSPPVPTMCPVPHFQPLGILCHSVPHHAPSTPGTPEPPSARVRNPQPWQLRAEPTPMSLSALLTWVLRGFAHCCPYITDMATCP